MVNTKLLLASLATLASITSASARKFQIDSEFYTGPECNGPTASKHEKTKEGDCDSLASFRSMRFHLHQHRGYDKTQKTCRFLFYQEKGCKRKPALTLTNPDFPEEGWSSCAKHLDEQANSDDSSDQVVGFKSFKIECDESPKSSSSTESALTQTVAYVYPPVSAAVLSTVQDDAAVLFEPETATTRATTISMSGQTTQVELPQETVYDETTSLVTVESTTRTAISTQVTTTLPIETTSYISDVTTIISPTTTIFSQPPTATSDIEVQVTTTVPVEETQYIADVTTYVSQTTTYLTLDAETTVSPQYTITTSGLKRRHARDVTAKERTVTSTSQIVASDSGSSDAASGAAPLTLKGMGAFDATGSVSNGAVIYHGGLTHTVTVHASGTPIATVTGSLPVNTTIPVGEYRSLSTNDFSDLVGHLANQMGGWVDDMQDDMDQAKDDLEQRIS